MRFHNNIGLQVCCGRSGWSQSTVATRLARWFRHQPQGRFQARSAAPLCGRQRPHIPRGGFKFLSRSFSRDAKVQGAYPTLWQAGNDAVLMEVAPVLAMSHVAGTCDSGFLSKIVHDASVRAASSPTPLVRASAKTRKRASVIGNLQREIHKARGAG